MKPLDECFRNLSIVPEPPQYLNGAEVTGSWFFEYHCDPSPQSMDYPAAQRTHQQVTILRELGPDEVDREEVGRMFDVRFQDGLVWSVFADELLYAIGDSHETPG